jgi:hypothetical protein
MNRRVALGVSGVAVAVAAVGGVAYAADTNSPASTPTNSASTASSTTAPAKGKAKRHAHALAGRALHGQFTVERKGQPAVVDVQRGAITKVDSTSLEVKSTDGFTATYVLNPSTTVRADGKKGAVSDLTVGKQVGVLADDAGGHPAARAVRVLKK